MLEHLKPVLSRSSSYRGTAGRMTYLPITLSEDRDSEKSRLVAIHLAIHTLRLMEHWRQSLGDYDSAIILLALTAISAEKLTRSGLPEELHDLAQPIPLDQLARCNISSIAAATGFNRETARRKVNQLIADGVIIKRDDGSLCFTPGFSQKGEIIELVWQQLETIRRTTNHLIRDGALQVRKLPERR